MRSGAAVTMILSNGACCGPAVVAVADPHLDIAAALLAEPLLRLRRKLLDQLDAVDLAGELREDRGLVAEAGADLRAQCPRR